MKFYVALISLLLCCTLILAQKNCPSACPAIFSPVCVEGNVRGRPVRCQFSNSCEMGASNCRKPINWRQTGCRDNVPNCSSVI